MGTRVYTEAICDRCGERKMEPDNAGGTPKGWEWTHNLSHTPSETLLCPRCNQDFAVFMREKTR